MAQLRSMTKGRPSSQLSPRLKLDQIRAGMGTPQVPSRLPEVKGQKNTRDTLELWHFEELERMHNRLREREAYNMERKRRLLELIRSEQRTERLRQSPEAISKEFNCVDISLTI